MKTMQHQQSAFAAARCETHRLASTSGRDHDVRSHWGSRSLNTFGQGPTLHRAWHMSPMPRRQSRNTCTAFGGLGGLDDSDTVDQTPSPREPTDQLSAAQPHPEAAQHNGSDGSAPAAVDRVWAAADDNPARPAMTPQHARGDSRDSSSAHASEDGSSLVESRSALDASCTGAGSRGTDRAIRQGGWADEEIRSEAAGDDSDADNDEDTESGSEEPSDDDEDNQQPDVSSAATVQQDAGPTVPERVRALLHDDSSGDLLCIIGIGVTACIYMWVRLLLCKRPRASYSAMFLLTMASISENRDFPWRLLMSAQTRWLSNAKRPGHEAVTGSLGSCRSMLSSRVVWPTRTWRRLQRRCLSHSTGSRRKPSTPSCKVSTDVMFLSMHF